MRVESVVDATVAAGAEGEAQRRAARNYVRARDFQLLRRGSIFVNQVLDGVLAFRRHLRIQLEWLDVQVGGHFAIQLV